MSTAILLNKLEIVAREELLNALEGLLDKNKDWWSNKVLISLNNYQDTYAKKEQLDSLDLNGLVSVFCFNFKDFIKKKEINGWELFQYANSVRSIRNYLAHLNIPIEIALTSEKSIYYLLTYKNFINKIREVVTSKTHEIMEEVNKELILQMERFNETYSNHYKKNQSATEKNIPEYSEIMNAIQNLSLQLKVNNSVSKDDSQINDNYKNEEYDFQKSDSEKIDELEAKDLLIGLREKIRRIYRNILRDEGILKDDLLNFILEHRISDIEKFNSIPNNIKGKIDTRQMDQIDMIFNIIKKIKQI